MVCTYLLDYIKLLNAIQKIKLMLQDLHLQTKEPMII